MSAKDMFKILEKYTDKLTKIHNSDLVSNVRYGYAPRPVTKYRIRPQDIEKWGYDSPHWVETFSSPKEFNTILIDAKSEPPYRLLLPPKDVKEIENKNLRNYIKENKLNSLRKRPPYKIIWPRTPYNRVTIFLNQRGVLAIDHIELEPSFDSKALTALLNSTLIAFFQEIHSRTNLGLGTLKIEAMDVNTIPIPKIEFVKKYKKKLVRLFDKISKKPPESILTEIGTSIPEEVSLNKVKKDRRELDKVVMGDILGLTDEEQLEVYRAVVDLVKSRIEKAKSVARKKKAKKIDVDALVESVLSEVGEMKKFPDDYIGSFKFYDIKEIPKGAAKVGSDVYGFYVEINGEKIRCKDVTEAKYIAYAAMNQETSIKIPTKREVMENAVKDYASVLRKTKKRISDFLEIIPDKKIRKQVKSQVWKKLGIYEAE
jgi:chorismate mutase